MAQAEILLDVGTNELEIIEFFIDEGPGRSPSPFGVNVAKVLEVVENPGLSPLPGASHPCLAGALALRGMPLPVLDLAVWLDITRLPRQNETILVTRCNARTIGFLATGVGNIHRVRWPDVQPPPAALARLDGSCITGLVRVEDRFVQLLDLEKVLYEIDDGLRPDQGMPRPAARRLRALVADDSGITRRLVREHLEAANFEVTLAGDGRQALELLRREGTPLPDIVVSDIEMPRMDGYTLTRAVKEDPGLRAIPVVLFSSLITDELRHKGARVGADGQIAKPQCGNLAAMALSLIAARSGRFEN